MAHAGERLVNPRTGQQMIFRRTSRDTEGALLQIDTVNPPHRSGELEHVHPEQVSSAEVVAGTLHFSVRGQTRAVHAGEKIVIPANTPHYFWNECDEDARAIQEFRPALQTERFFETYFGLAQEGKLNEKGMPSLLQLAVLVPAFSREIRPTSPPWPLLQGISWLLGPVARLRGHRTLVPHDRA